MTQARTATAPMLALSGFCCAIDSMLPIPGAAPRTVMPPDAEAPITVRLLEGGAPAAAGPESFSRAGDAIRYTAPQTARFDCRADNIEITPFGAPDPDRIARLLVANALPASLWQRGALLLHAAVLLPPGRDTAFAICGPSGSGKSMLAAQWVDAGARLVADDVMALGGDGDMTRGGGLGAGLVMRPDAAGVRRFVRLAPERQLRTARLGAIFLLDRAPAGSPAHFERLGALAALEAVLQQRHRPIVPQLLGRQAAVLAQARDMATAIPVWRWQRPQGRMAMDAAESDFLQAALA
jgi:hypothetical protein